MTISLDPVESLAVLRHELRVIERDTTSRSEDSTVAAKSRICLSVRNLWDDFLFRLGDFDRARTDPNFTYSDESRVKFARLDERLSEEVKEVLEHAQRLMATLAASSEDEYLASVRSKYNLLSRELS